MPHDLALSGSFHYDGTGAPGQNGEVVVVRSAITRARSSRVIPSA